MWFPLILGLLSTIYYYIIRNRDFFLRKNVPFVKSAPLFGTSWKAIFGFESYFAYYRRIYQKFPENKFFGVFELLQPVFVIRDPALYRKIFITNFDHFMNRRLMVDREVDPVGGLLIGVVRNEEWRRLRNITSPAFTANKLKFILTLVNGTMKRINEDLGQKITKKGNFRFEAIDFYTRCATDLIAHTTFGLNVNSINEENNEFYLMGKKLTDFTKKFFWRATLLTALPKVAKFLEVALFDKEATKYFQGIIREIVEFRQKNDVKIPNFIQLFMEADLSFDEIVSVSTAFFFGGIDSFATLWQFMSYELAMNPEVQEKLQEEIDSVANDLKNPEEIDYEAIKKLIFMDAVIEETFRKHPSTAWLERVCNKSFTLREKTESEEEVVLNPGDIVVIPNDAIQNDPKIFEDPDKFQPERFLEKKISGEIMPFGLGPRQCIATRFALMQTKVFFFNLLSKFTIKKNEETVEEFNLVKGTMLRKVEGGILLDFVKRN
ncbi:cytochrome P450 9e2-like [Culicoides brevitarsis]|uniref:cytochrome P450 9e2-like n=1 Tax=Culicoides brevitarsis TaxID=469753 RepID=UPI00307C5D07